MINVALDRRIEDKFILEANFVDHLASYDVASKTLMYETNPHINQGTTGSSRIGDKVMMKLLRIQIRYRPGRTSLLIPTGPGWAPPSCPFPQYPTVKVFLISIDADTAALGQPTLRNAAAIKFREDGKYRQDVQQEVLQTVYKSMRLVAKATMKVNYRSASFIHPKYDAVSNSAVRIVKEPLVSYCVLKATLKEKLLYNIGNVPARKRYFIYVQFSNKWHDPVYNPIAAPGQFDQRALWVYEDA